MTMLEKSMSFYSHPPLVVLLYAIPGFLSILLVHWVAKTTMFKVSKLSSLRHTYKFLKSGNLSLNLSNKAGGINFKQIFQKLCFT